jgi:hypothetical protein
MFLLQRIGGSWLHTRSLRHEALRAETILKSIAAACHLAATLVHGSTASGTGMTSLCALALAMHWWGILHHGPAIPESLQSCHATLASGVGSPHFKLSEVTAHRT